MKKNPVVVARVGWPGMPPYGVALLTGQSHSTLLSPLFTLRGYSRLSSALWVRGESGLRNPPDTILIVEVSTLEMRIGEPTRLKARCLVG